MTFTELSVKALSVKFDASNPKCGMGSLHHFFTPCHSYFHSPSAIMSLKSKQKTHMAIADDHHMSGLIYRSPPGDVNRRAWYPARGVHIILRHTHWLLTVDIRRNGFPVG